jgi:hypothetical protein
MSKVFVLLSFAAAMAAANPVTTAILSEYQAAPESLARVEVHLINFPNETLDLSNYHVCTRAGTATIDSGIEVTDSDYVVLDRSNMTGAFALADDSDHIVLMPPSGADTVDYVAYPGGMAHAGGRGWTPRPGMSCALDCYYVWVPPPDPPEQSFVWYVDSTPTFGQPNDDTQGGISGYVYDQDSNPLDNASVQISCPQGYRTVYTSGFENPSGYYLFNATGPGTYRVSASWGGFSAAYAESVRLGADESRSGVDIYLYVTGVPDRPARRAPAVRGQGRLLDITVPERAPLDLTVVNVLGQVARRQRIELAPGPNTIALDDLPRGVYFVQLETPNYRECRKLIITE